MFCGKVNYLLCILSASLSEYSLWNITFTSEALLRFGSVKVNFNLLICEEFDSEVSSSFSNSFNIKQGALKYWENADWKVSSCGFAQIKGLLYFAHTPFYSLGRLKQHNLNVRKLYCYSCISNWNCTSYCILYFLTAWTYCMYLSCVSKAY